MRRWIVLLIVTLAAPPVLEAQTAATWRYGFFGSVGWSFFGADEGGLGGGASFGVGLEMRPFRRLGFELEVNRVHYRRWLDPPEVPEALRELLGVPSEPELLFEGTALFVTGNIVYHVDVSERFRPYFLGGAGVVKDSSKRTAALPKVPEQTVNEFTLNAAAGIEIVVSRRVSIRPEFRTSNFLILSSWDSRMYQNRFSVALAYLR